MGPYNRRGGPCLDRGEPRLDKGVAFAAWAWSTRRGQLLVGGVRLVRGWGRKKDPSLRSVSTSEDCRIILKGLG